MFEHREMTGAELHERLNQISVTVQRIRFQDGREAYYHAKRWASEQNKPIRQELKRRQGAGSGGSAPEAEDLMDYQRGGSTEADDLRAMQSEYRPFGGC